MTICATTPQAYLDRVCDFIGIAHYPVPAAAAEGEMINSISDLPRFPRVARKARHFMHWLEEKQAYSTSNFLERAGVWKFFFGGGDRSSRQSIRQSKQTCMKRCFLKSKVSNA